MANTTHDERRDRFAWPLFSTGLSLLALSWLFQNPLCLAVLHYYGYTTLMTGGILLGWKLANRVAARHALQLVHTSEQLRLPARGMPFPEWQEQHFRRFGPPK